MVRLASTQACRALAIAVSALRTPAQEGESASEIDVPEARKEVAQATDGDADSMAQGVSKKGAALPPLPKSATYKTWCVFQDGSIAVSCRLMAKPAPVAWIEGRFQE